MDVPSYSLGLFTIAATLVFPGISKPGVEHDTECTDVMIWLLSVASRYLPAPPSSSCRLNLRLFIACGSRAELWVSMLRGWRG